jgi:thioredoxin reductase (NADPH)
MEKWDIIIIGAGAAGLTAGLYGARSGLKTLILEKQLPGGATVESPWIENYPGFPSISGQELGNKMVEHTTKFGVQVNQLESVTELDVKGEETRIVKTSKTSYEAGAIIIATGSHHRELGAKGEKEFSGKGVSYCALCDGAFFKGKKVVVVGGGNNAATSAQILVHLASNVKVVHRRDDFRAEEILLDSLRKANVEFLMNTEVKEIKGDSSVKSIVVFNNKSGETKEIQVNGVFVQVGEVPNSDFAKNAGVQVDEEGYIIVDLQQRTNIPGVYAAGDVTNSPVKQVGTAVGQGIIAAVNAFGYIRRPYYYKD